MRYILKFSFPNERGNQALANPQFGAKMQQLLTDLKAEAAYFTTVDGERGGYIVFQMDQAHQIPAIAEPFFVWLNAKIEFIPVMIPEDLMKAGPSIDAVFKKWS